MTLYNKYRVTENGEQVEDCFVLEPESDEAARIALHTYAAAIDDDELAADIREWLAAIEVEEYDHSDRKPENLDAWHEANEEIGRILYGDDE